ncbi:3-hydroxyacyl-CoA dehydrogenase [Noviherbaspirillum pedocola]|uniref:3-hydroxyacyl-CoA dehydrogenase n=1 Tax=Noviherbaspirillum pedocola TaxID=2801341 RepID=A0A934SPH8_9BURK|nr:3-hydroxyacyl-CoA dehydrogenase [Noviherbaspirillum pedocola]MBK4733100.1 3-hydroxyacyl-CoA dehydrogenase [Noviherbaspirillum pedocola]
MQALERPDPVSGDVVIGIVGCGVMGRGIAQIAAQAGATVWLNDTRADAAQAAKAGIADTFNMLAGKGKMSAEAAQAACARLNAAASLEDLAGCHVVVEAIVEKLEAKQSLFAALENILGEDAILATNTSSLSVTAIAAGLKHPERVVGFHFFNPVPLMKIVEAIGGLLTEPSIVDYMLALGRRWGHTAVRAKDTPGFIVNHAGRGFGTEGLRILAEDVTDIATLDRILRDGPGFRLGPCELMDLTGLDVSHPVMESIYHQYYEEPRFRPQNLTRQMLAAGAVGRKVGHGFYRYDAEGKKQTPAEPAPSSALPPSVWLSRARPQLAERIAPFLKAAGVAIEDGERPSENALIVVTPLGDDATRCCVVEGLDARRTVAVETLFDLTRRRVVMTNPATDARYADMARGLFAADGAAVSLVRDSSGLVSQRVVAHIINIAAEIAQQGIAEPADIDRAVTLGLGYPRGPLAWGDELGAATVLNILGNLQQETGDPRYRPSQWLRRRAELGLSLLQREP